MLKIFIITFHLMFISNIIIGQMSYTNNVIEVKSITSSVIDNTFRDIQNSISFKKIDANFNNMLNGVSFYNDSNFVAVGDSIYIDGNLNDSLKITYIGVKLNSIDFYDSTYGVAVGDSGSFLFIVDGNITEKKVLPEINFYSVWCINSNSAIAVGSNGVFAYIEGNTITGALQTNTKKDLYDIAFYDDHGFIVGDSTILISRNFGSSWGSLSGGYLKLTSVIFKSFDKISIVSNEKTKNGWIPLYNFTLTENDSYTLLIDLFTGINAPLFETINYNPIYESEIIFCSDSLTFYDRGNLYSLNNHYLKGLDFKNDGGVFVGENGDIYKFSYNYPSDINADKNILPDNFVLHQNYPNPFNPTTMISYTLPTDSKVKVEIFNMLGQSVAVLVNGKKSAGYYESTWNAQNLPSGIYLINIRAEGLDSKSNFSQVRKALLLK